MFDGNFLNVFFFQNRSKYAKHIQPNVNARVYGQCLLDAVGSRQIILPMPNLERP